MKELFLILLFFFPLSSLLAQEKNQLQIGGDLNIVNESSQKFNQPLQYRLWKNYDIGVNYFLTDKFSVGLKYFNQTLSSYDMGCGASAVSGSDFNSIDENALRSFHVDCNYNLSPQRSKLSHFIEFGAGVSSIRNSDVLIYYHVGPSSSIQQFKVFPKYSISENVAYGIEFKHLRLSIGYLFLFPKTKVIYRENRGYYGALESSGYTLDYNSEHLFLDRLSVKLGIYIPCGKLSRNLKR